VTRANGMRLGTQRGNSWDIERVAHGIPEIVCVGDTRHGSVEISQLNGWSDFHDR
jgi:hypothetical protein